MAFYSLTAIGGTGLGPVMAGYIEMNPHFEWRWIQWFHLMCVMIHRVFIYSTDCFRSVTGVLFISILLALKETRSGVLLTRLAKRIRKETGDHRHRARIEDERGSLKNLIFISCTRPLRASDTILAFPYSQLCKRTHRPSYHRTHRNRLQCTSQFSPY